jgi:hypothetical protein
MTDWVKREFSKADIDRYGEALRDWWGTREAEIDEDDFDKGMDVIQNWRSSHALPLLTFRMALTKRARAIEQNAIIAQRLKRLTSVLAKLTREPTMKLSQMQDLGGCRAILSSIESVKRLASFYRNPIRGEQGQSKCYDYIENPKPDGYRGIHIVGRYRARITNNDIWNGQRIEIQLRTKLQHAFATAVETVATFTRSGLKSGKGDRKWRRFFSLMGSAIAIREKTPLVPGIPPRIDDLVGELRDTARELKVKQRLRGWTDAIRSLPRSDVKRGQPWLLLELDVSRQMTGRGEFDF